MTASIFESFISQAITQTNPVDFEQPEWQLTTSLCMHDILSKTSAC